MRYSEVCADELFDGHNIYRLVSIVDVLDNVIRNAAFYKGSPRKDFKIVLSQGNFIMKRSE